MARSLSTTFIILCVTFLTFTHAAVPAPLCTLSVDPSKGNPECSGTWSVAPSSFITFGVVGDFHPSVISAYIPKNEIVLEKVGSTFNRTTQLNVLVMNAKQVDDLANAGCWPDCELRSQLSIGENYELFEDEDLFVVLYGLAGGTYPVNVTINEIKPQDYVMDTAGNAIKIGGMIAAGVAALLIILDFFRCLSLSRHKDDTTLYKRKFKPMVTWFLISFFGIIGVHRYYLHSFGIAFLMTITAGFFGIMWIVDLALVTDLINAANHDAATTQLGAAALSALASQAKLATVEEEGRKTKRAKSRRKVEREESESGSESESEVSLPSEAVDEEEELVVEDFDSSEF